MIASSLGCCEDCDPRFLLYLVEGLIRNWLVIIFCDVEVPVPYCLVGFDEDGAPGGGVSESTNTVVLHLEHYVCCLLIYCVVFLDKF